MPIQVLMLFDVDFNVLEEKTNKFLKTLCQDQIKDIKFTDCIHTGAIIHSTMVIYEKRPKSRQIFDYSKNKNIEVEDI